MLKIIKIIHVIQTTKILQGNRIIFLIFFLLTHCMSFSLRNMRPLGLMLKKVFSYFPHPEFIIKNSQGVWSVFPFNDGMTISADYFEEELREWPGKTNQRRIFIDIGANIGKYTLIASNIFKYSNILSIEANPVTAELLRKNINLNNLEQKVLINQVAVGSFEGEVIIQSDRHHLGGGNIVSLKDVKTISMDESFRVKLCTVDSIFEKTSLSPKDIDFIKIDIEGMEKSALEGMVSILSNMSKGSAIMIEISQNKDQVKKMLSDYGFELREKILNDYLFMKVL
jgi:FkbM family methyltransferase